MLLHGRGKMKWSLVFALKKGLLGINPPQNCFVFSLRASATRIYNTDTMRVTKTKPRRAKIGYILKYTLKSNLQDILLLLN